MKAVLTSLALICAVSLSAQVPPPPPSPQPPARPPGVGTRAELEDRARTDQVRDAVRSASASGRTGDDDRRSAQAFADCTVGRQPTESRIVVVTPLSDVELDRRYPRLLRWQCFEGGVRAQSIASMTFPFPTTHLILADALVRRDYAMGGPADLMSVPLLQPIPSPAAASPDELADMPARDRQRRIETDAGIVSWSVLQRLGDCVARRAPEGVRTLALSGVATPEERTRLGELQPAMAACIPPGTSVRMRPADVRGASVLAYYRLAYAIAPAPTTTAEARR